MYNEKSYADVAQLVEQLIRNQQVAGPSPAISSKRLNKVLFYFNDKLATCCLEKCLSFFEKETRFR